MDRLIVYPKDRSKSFGVSGTFSPTTLDFYYDSRTIAFQLRYAPDDAEFGSRIEIQHFPLLVSGLTSSMPMKELVSIVYGSHLRTFPSPRDMDDVARRIRLLGFIVEKVKT